MRILFSLFLAILLLSLGQNIRKLIAVRLEKAPIAAEITSKQTLRQKHREGQAKNLKERLEDEREIVSTLNQELNERNRREDSETKLEELRLEIAKQQQVAGTILQQWNQAIQQTFDIYAERDRRMQEQQLDEENTLNSLQREIDSQENQSELTQKKLSDLKTTGIPSDELAKTQAEYNEEIRRLNLLRSQYRAQQLRYRQEKTLNQQKRIWQERADQETLRARFQGELQKAQEAYQNLEKEYETLSKAEEEQRRVTEDLTQRYLEHRRIYDELQALALQKQTRSPPSGGAANYQQTQ